MFKNLFFLSLFLSLPVLGESNSTPQGENIQIGRYQMVGLAEKDRGHSLYLLDTATGCVWKSTAKNNWIEHDAWQLQIVTTPNNR